MTIIIIIIIAKGNLTNLLGKGINCSHIQCKGNLELISLEKWTLWGLPGGSPGGWAPAEYAQGQRHSAQSM